VIVATLAASDAHATNFYVDVVNGSNTTGNGTVLNPWKSITEALTHIDSLGTNGHTVYVAPGTYAYNSTTPADGETFPLTSNKTRIAIRNTGTKPLITAAGVPSGHFSGKPVACFAPNDLWVLDGLVIDNSGYDKSSGAAPYNQIHGVYIDDLPTAFATTECDFVENFWGIWIADTGSSSVHVDPRDVSIEGCTFTGHGPTLPPTGQPDTIGHAAVMVGAKATLTATITDCTFSENHDGIEGGQSSTYNSAELVVSQCDFDRNENGLEMQDGTMRVEGCVFTDNGRFDPSSGGGVTSSSFTIALGSRAQGSNVRWQVRRCTFENNQLAVGIYDAVEIAASPIYDFGTDLTTDPGENLFLTDITVPWPNNYNQSTCGMWTNHPNPVYAVGNVWTYDSGGGANNQNCDSAGEYKSGSTQIVTFGTNTTGTGFPVLRPTSGTTNVPWNVATGLSTGPSPNLARPMIILEP
jgi:hypothetical protein